MHFNLSRNQIASEARAVENQAKFRLLDPCKIRVELGDMSLCSHFYQFSLGPNRLCTFGGSPLGLLGY